MGCFFPTVLVFFWQQVRPLEEEKVRPQLQFVSFTLKVAGSQSTVRGKIQIIQIHKIANTNTNMGRSTAAICHSWCKCKRGDICKITFGIYLENLRLLSLNHSLVVLHSLKLFHMAIVQFTVWDSETPETPETPRLPRLLSYYFSIFLDFRFTTKLRDSQDSVRSSSVDQWSWSIT